jgi:catechol 2,3-dioxygenase-like lactoylglutathione lyase family enzyme
MSSQKPELTGVLETSLYHATAESAEMLRLYRDVLGLPVSAQWPDGVALRLGAGVVLLFDREKLADRDEAIAGHGTVGPGHVCFLAASDDYERWGERLASEGIEVHHEQHWDGGRRSFYFRDPAGNLLEIADADLWDGGCE